MRFVWCSVTLWKGLSQVKGSLSNIETKIGPQFQHLWSSHKYPLASLIQFWQHHWSNYTIIYNRIRHRARMQACKCSLLFPCTGPDRPKSVSSHQVANQKATITTQCAAQNASQHSRSPPIKHPCQVGHQSPHIQNRPLSQVSLAADGTGKPSSRSRSSPAGRWLHTSPDARPRKRPT